MPGIVLDTIDIKVRGALDLLLGSSQPRGEERLRCESIIGVHCGERSGCAGERQLAYVWSVKQTEKGQSKKCKENRPDV